MAEIPELRSPIVDAIYALWEQNDAPRDAVRVRMSGLGHACERALWYQFRWVAHPERFDGRMLRLFDRGSREEAVFARELRGLGVDLITHTRDGQQLSAAFAGGHVFGYLDGVAREGVPGAEKSAHVVEFKTHGAKSFARLVKEGVGKAKPDHMAQMQIYMHVSAYGRALYLAVNKDTDELYAERVAYDAAAGAALEAKALRVVKADAPPPRLHDDPNGKMAWECKGCPARAVCHEGAAPRQTCRSCVHATAVTEGEGGRWRCEKHRREISTEWQRDGCPSYLMLPSLVDGEPIAADPDANTITYRRADGVEFTLGGADGTGAV